MKFTLGMGGFINSREEVIYLDHNATTPILPDVVDAMLPWLRKNWGNPSSIYGSGRIARRAVEEARERVAGLVGARPEQVVFTSGATEANNAAIHSEVFRDPAKRHIVTSAVEHSAVLAYCDYLEKVHGVEVTRLGVNSDGLIDQGELKSAIRPETALVSLMAANNETGVIWPIPDLAVICWEQKVPFHSDSVQAIGKIPVSFSNWGLSFMSLSGHKFGAPKGTGALIINDQERFQPLIHGGGQERGARGGTENVAHIVALGKAAELACQRDSAEWKQSELLRDQFEQTLLDRISESRVNGLDCWRLPNTSNITLPGIDGDALVTFLDKLGICISSGSACLESAITPSHVILAMTGSHRLAEESIRVSLGLESSEEELERLIDALLSFSDQLI